MDKLIRAAMFGMDLRHQVHVRRASLLESRPRLHPENIPRILDRHFRPTWGWVASGFLFALCPLLARSSTRRRRGYIGVFVVAERRISIQGSMVFPDDDEILGEGSVI